MRWWRRRSSAGCGSSPSAAAATASAWSTISDRGLCADAARSSMPASDYRLRLPLVGRLPGRERAGGGRPCASPPAASRPRSSRRSRGSRAPRAGSSWSARSNGAPIFVDYAHKPDALAKALEALRPYVERPAGRGVRRRRRPRRGQAAVDGRRSPPEGRSRHRHRRQSAQRRPGRDPRRDPAGRAAARSRSATAREAIRGAVAELRRGDVLLIAGKGHETGQIVGKQVLPFSDHEAVAAALAGEGGMSDRAALDRRGDGAGDAAPQPRRRAAAGRRRAFRSTRRTHRAGRGVLRHQGRHRDGHDFVAAALAAGAGLAVVAADKRARFPGDGARCSSCPTCSPACAIWRGRRARARRRKSSASPARSARPAPRRRCALALAGRRRDPCLGRLLQQSLGRAAVARALPADGALRRVRDRHEPCRRDRAADRGWCARMWRSSPRSSRCISNSSPRSRRSPTPRPKSSSGSSRAAPR